MSYEKCDQGQCGLNYGTVSEFILFLDSEASEGVRLSLPGENRLHLVFSIYWDREKKHWSDQ